MKRKFTIGAIVVAAATIIIAAVFVSADRGAKTATEGVAVYTQNAEGVPDGTYIGHYEIAPVKVTVEVSVIDEKISGVVILEHVKGLGGKAERIVNDVMDRQSLDVDAVSGATVSSKTILKAIENALTEGVK